MAESTLISIQDEMRTDAPQRSVRRSNESMVAAQRSLFVNNARFWSMVAIVAVHGIGAVLLRAQPSLLWLVESFAKFGTIDFFIISGFLLGDSFETGSRSLFVRRRLKKILLPWSVWFLIMTAWVLISEGLLKHKPGLDTIRIIGAGALNTLTSTAFWFVPNLFFSICLLLVFRKNLRSPWLGLSLFLITAFYTVNIYTCWLPSAHTVAIGGYMFFLWLGALISRNYEWLLSKVQRISIPVMFLICGLLMWVAVREAHFVSRFTSLDPMNTLRFSNQLFSIAVIFLMMRLRTATWPSFLDVRNQMFGVYLMHSIVLRFLVGLWKRSANIWPVLGHGRSPHTMVAIAMLLTVLIFTISATLTSLIASQPRWKWLVGDLSKKAVKQVELTAAA